MLLLQMQMAQTPLHVSAGYNRAEIVKFLLEFPGPEKVELEAKNMVSIFIYFFFFFFLPPFVRMYYLYFINFSSSYESLRLDGSYLYWVRVIDNCSMGKLLCTWQQRMDAMMLHGCYLLMVLLLKPKQMYFFLVT